MTDRERVLQTAPANAVFNQRAMMRHEQDEAHKRITAYKIRLRTLEAEKFVEAERKGWLTTWRAIFRMPAAF